MKKNLKNKLDDTEKNMINNTLFNHISEKEHYSAFLFISKPWQNLYIFSILLKSDYPQFLKEQDAKLYLSDFLIKKFHTELNMKTIIGDIFSRYGEFSYKIEFPFNNIKKQDLDKIKEIIIQFNEAFTHFFNDKNQRNDYETNFEPYYNVFKENNLLKQKIINFDENKTKIKKRI